MAYLHVQGGRALKHGIGTIHCIVERVVHLKGEGEPLARRRRRRRRRRSRRRWEGRSGRKWQVGWASRDATWSAIRAVGTVSA